MSTVQCSGLYAACGAVLACLLYSVVYYMPPTVQCLHAVYGDDAIDGEYCRSASRRDQGSVGIVHTLPPALRSDGNSST